MSEEKKMGQVISIDEKLIKDHLGELVRGTVEETLSGMLDAEADRLCGGEKHERSPDLQDYRAGYYQRNLAISTLTFFTSPPRRIGPAYPAGFCRWEWLKYPV